MAGRVSVWSQEAVVLASQRFVPAADEVWRLQRGVDRDCLFFQRAVNRGQPIVDDGTRQGTYVFAPSGKLLARANSLSSDRILEVLKQGWAAWEALPADERRLAPDVRVRPEHRWEDNVPVDGLVLERIARDLVPRGDARSKRLPVWNRDYAWFAHDELRGFLPKTIATGAQGQVATALVERLARFHLVDNARGQTGPYAPSEIVEAELSVKVTHADAVLASLVFEGHTQAVSDGVWKLADGLWRPRQELPHGIEVRLRGRAEYDRTTGTFLSFELVGVGRRWGRTETNGRGRDPKPGRIGFAFTLSQGAPAVAPAFLSLYEAPWVRPPANPGRTNTPLPAGR